MLEFEETRLRKRDEEELALSPLNAVGGATEGAAVGAVPGREGDLRPKPKTFEKELEADCSVGGGICRLEDGTCAGVAPIPSGIVLDDSGAVSGLLPTFRDRKPDLVGLGVRTDDGSLTSSGMKLLFPRGDVGVGPGRLPNAVFGSTARTPLVEDWAREGEGANGGGGI